MKVYFEVKRWSRLGNWMFQYAAARSLSEDVACYVEVPELVGQMRRFDWFKGLEILTAKPERCAEFCQPSFRYTPIRFPSDETALSISGYFQSAKFFEESVVRDLFLDDKRLLKSLSLKYANVLSRPRVTSIHVRRGDYLWNLYAHPFVGKKYYADAISKMPEVQDFVVCSDDLPWCRAFFNKKRFPGRNFVFSDEDGPIEDIYLCSLCQNHIIGNSSFAWWGAWLDPKKSKRVLAPSLWFGYYYSKFGWDWRDIYFDGVEVINNDYDFLRWCQGHLCEYWLRFKKFALPEYRYACRVISWLRR